jgi:CubicO group peptidase (beta-lactamase class C family)
VRTNTRFWIASGGKQFTSAAILKCQEKGWLRLDDPITRFLPNAPADKRTITIRQLLSHLSGLGQSYASEGVPDRQTAVKRMLDEPLIDTPSKTFHYSNSNYQLAVAIVEVASRRSYQDFVVDQLWRPAGLQDTGFSGDAVASSVAPAREETPARLARPGWGGEGVYSTTHDLLRWYRVLRSGRVLSLKSVSQLFKPVTPIGEGKAALGWFIGRTDNNAMRTFTRGNEDFGPNGLIYAYPDTATVIIVLTHAGQANPELSWSRLAHAKIEKLMLL